MENKVGIYHCSNCSIHFYPKETYDNPFFLADKVADCPRCTSRCWLIKIYKED